MDRQHHKSEANRSRFLTRKPTGDAELDVVSTKWPPPMPNWLKPHVDKPWIAVVFGLLAAGAVVLTILGVDDYMFLPDGVFVILIAVLSATMFRWWVLSDSLRDTTALEQEVTSLRNLLKQVTERQHSAFEEERTSHYQVSPDGNDQATITLSTKATEADGVPWRQAPFKTLHHARLLDMSPDPVVSGDRVGEYHVISEPTQITFIIFFEPPLTNDEPPAEWTVSFVWPGLWDAFRKDGADEGGFQTYTWTKKQRLEVLLPSSLINKPLALSNRNPDVGESGNEELETGERLLWWELVDPEPQHYSYWLRTPDEKPPRFD